MTPATDHLACEVCGVDLDAGPFTPFCDDDDCTEMVVHCWDHCDEALALAPAAAFELAAAMRKLEPTL